MSSVPHSGSTFARASLHSPQPSQRLHLQIADTPASNPMTFGWVLKRTALGISILVFSFGAIAWLTYASIEQNEHVLASPKNAVTQ